MMVILSNLGRMEGLTRGAGRHRKTLVFFCNGSWQMTRKENRIIGRIAVGVLYQIS